ncbi:MAG: twitch domain-containing radical SAM protein [Rhizobacter sp.]|nr:twitch domain-containing radical SAM protein [Bacteriovorax sp.]
MTENKNELNINNMLFRMKEVEEKSGSSSMCIAKWMQSTVYLMNGTTHSCHHPAVHKIPLSEIKDNPSALHNTSFKRAQREKMLQGKRPSECQYCWQIEDLGGNHISDRVYKSTDEDWAYPYLEKVLKEKVGKNNIPSYLEVAFDSTCNMKCMYCTPEISTQWMEEVKKFGAYEGTTHRVGNLEWIKSQDRIPMLDTENNPYIKAFWQWWPDLYKELKTFRITGGEPLLSVNTWKVLDVIKANPRKDFSLAINTNLQVHPQILNRFINYYNEIAPNIKSFKVYTSAEAHGAQAEYIRFGMNYDSFLYNIKDFLKRTHANSQINLMITFNVLSLSTFDLFLKDILSIRREFNVNNGFNRLPMMINYLRWPEFQNVRVAPFDVKKKYIEKIKEYMLDNSSVRGCDEAGIFYLEEVDQVNRLELYMFSPMKSDDLKRQFKDFKVFYREYDKRKNISMKNLFPEYSALYEAES